ncbi:DUF4135 domain-containing protein [Rothia aeria]|nr:DUF4135 domain-containing protein [Rothia aeria]
MDGFYTSYPLLRRVHSIIVHQFHAIVAELFERIQAQESGIRELLGAQNAEPLTLESLTMAGDYHNGGRTGCLLVFSQGRWLINHVALMANGRSTGSFRNLRNRALPACVPPRSFRVKTTGSWSLLREKT